MKYRIVLHAKGKTLGFDFITTIEAPNIQEAIDMAVHRVPPKGVEEITIKRAEFIGGFDALSY